MLAMVSLAVPRRWRKLALEQCAEHVGDSLAALERGNLDPAAHVGRDVDRQAGCIVFGG
jgi:hypothetical protein